MIHWMNVNRDSFWVQIQENFVQMKRKSGPGKRRWEALEMACRWFFSCVFSWRMIFLENQGIGYQGILGFWVSCRSYQLI